MDVFVPTDDGTWVSQEYQNLAEIIQDYDPGLELRYIPVDKRTRDDRKPYMVLDTRTNSPVLYASELDTPADILERIFLGDNVRSGDVLKRVEAREMAIKALELKNWMDQLEQAADIAHFFVKSDKNVINHDGKKFDDQRRVIGTSHGRKHIT